MHEHKVDNNPEEILAQNTYNDLSQLTNKKVGGTVASSPLQSIDYLYNIRGWMTKINDPKNLNGKLFGYEIKYNTVEGLETPNLDYTGLKVKPKYNGNIADVDWRTGTTAGDYLRRYGYVYDSLNRLSAGFYQKDSNPSAKEYFEKMDYDLNGNITNLKRSAESQQGAAAFNINELTYTYANSNQSNRLTSVTDSSTDYRGYPDVSGIAIPYDVNGNMTSHKDKEILAMAYNFLNLPNRITFDQTYLVRNVFSGTTETRNITTSYLFRADGTKLNKIYMYGVGKNQSEAYKVTEYLDGFQYEGQGSSLRITRTLKFVPTAEGYYNFENNKYIYNYTDHLGNVRLSYYNNGSSVAVLEENNYYPFGMKHEGYNGLAGNSSHQYKYNGKELQETGMYDYGARMYMADIGRWGVMDPLSETSRRWSPYTYGYNNPIRFVDPDGRQNEDWVKRGNQIFYDSAITTQKQATDKYGDSAEHLAEGSTLTTTTNDEVTSELTFHDNGTITKADGSEKSTKETFEKGGISIIGTESKGLSMSLSVNGVLGGGFGFDVGLVKDAGNNWGLFFNRNINFGLGFEGGIGIGRISSSHSGPFLLEDYSGEAKSFISPVGITYGGTFDPKSTPLEMMNPLNVGAGKRGVTEISAGLKGIGTGVFYKRSKTSVWDF